MLCWITHAASYDCNGCADCNAKISSALPGDTVTLTADVSTDDSCVDMNGRTGIVYDCAGHTITGTDRYGKGVQIGSGGDITVKNCRIRSFYHGIYVHDTRNNTIEGSSLEDNNVGLYFSNARLSSAEANNITGSVYGGIFMGLGSEGSMIAGNLVSSSSVYSYGIDVYMSNSTSLSYNEVYSSQYGIKITASSYIEMYDNIACGHGVDDIYAYLSTGDSGDSNTCTLTGGWNDDGVSGCTYACQGTTTTSGPTTTSATTTSTTGGVTTTTLGPGIITCQSCLDCREKIDSAGLGKTVYLISNISTSLDTCIETIGKTGVTFDCNNHAIKSNGGSGTYGIYVESSTSMTLKNCVISGFGMGIVLYNRSDYSAVYRNVVEKSASEGISVFLTNHASVTDNVVREIPEDAFGAIGIVHSNRA